jgi:hypothetical protein
MRTWTIGICLWFFGTACWARSRPFEPWVCTGQFHQVIAEADRVVIRDGGFVSPDSLTNQFVLAVIIKTNEIRKIYQNLQFKTNQQGSVCAGLGYPGVDWYKGTNLLALTAMHGCTTVSWEGFPSDAFLSKASTQWLRKWFASLKLDKSKYR